MVHRDLLDAWGLADAAVAPLGGGLINTTYAVEHPRGRFVLQRVNPIFSAEIHENLRAVTEHLARAGVLTPKLVRTRADQLIVEREGIWRVLTRIEGIGLERLAHPDQARAAGRFVGGWHAALLDLDHAFVGLRSGVHDTPRHLANLERALADHLDHRLRARVEALATEILERAAALEALPQLEHRVAHGDLKINNLIFAGHERGQPALALVDLDTIGPMSLAHELGDAWRSWANRAGEDQPRAEFDLDFLRASWLGWNEGYGRELDENERIGLLLGPEWISLELSARFAADALAERYFGWSAERFATRGEHNLARALGQWSLHQAMVSTRAERSRLLGLG